MSAEKHAFIEAVRDGDIDRLTQMLDNGSHDIDDADCFGQTALMWATGKLQLFQGFHILEKSLIEILEFNADP